jgi:hypothetical protein
LSIVYQCVSARLQYGCSTLASRTDFGISSGFASVSRSSAFQSTRISEVIFCVLLSADGNREVHVERVGDVLAIPACEAATTRPMNVSGAAIPKVRKSLNPSAAENTGPTVFCF